MSSRDNQQSQLFSFVVRYQFSSAGHLLHKITFSSGNNFIETRWSALSSTCSIAFVGFQQSCQLLINSPAVSTTWPLVHQLISKFFNIVASLKSSLAVITSQPLAHQSDEAQQSSAFNATKLILLKMQHNISLTTFVQSQSDQLYTSSSNVAARFHYKLKPSLKTSASSQFHSVKSCLTVCKFFDYVHALSSLSLSSILIKFTFAISILYNKSRYSHRISWGNCAILKQRFTQLEYSFSHSSVAGRFDVSSDHTNQLHRLSHRI